MLCVGVSTWLRLMTLGSVTSTASLDKTTTGRLRVLLLLPDDDEEEEEEEEEEEDCNDNCVEEEDDGCDCDDSCCCCCGDGFRVLREGDG